VKSVQILNTPLFGPFDTLCRLTHCAVSMLSASHKTFTHCAMSHKLCLLLFRR